MSAAGRAQLIEKHEQAIGGGAELAAYQDPGGKWTIGYGNTGKEAKPGNTITQAKADQLLQQDLASREQEVRDHVHVPLTQGQFDALTSFVFNEGAGKFETSTLLKKLNAGDYAGAQKEFSKWTLGWDAKQQKMVVLDGLKNRRADEAASFGNQGPQAAPGK